MKFRKTSRLLAVLLALLLMLGSVSAVLADEDVYIPADQYAEMSDAAVQEYYEKLMACETHDEMMAVMARLSEEQYAAFAAKLTDEQLAAIDERDHELFEMLIGVPAVNRTSAGPLMGPVYISVMSRMLMTAAEGDSSSSDNGLVLNKTATAVDGGYQIMLEAYTTGKVQSTTTAVPCDIVLVLDESGSMDYYIGKTPVYNLDTSKTYYWVDVEGSSYEVKWSSDDGWHYSTRRGGNYPITPKTSADDTTNNSVQLYEEAVTRNSALTTAVNLFLGEIREDDANFSEDVVGHRVGIIGFSGNGNARTIRDLSTESLNDLASSALRTNGGTYIEDGLSQAVTMLNNSETTDVQGQTRSRVVVVFTDGNPGTGDWNDGDSKQCAADAIGYANTLKKATADQGCGATVYSIGIFSGANPSDTTGNSNQFMNAVSSNYPNATASYGSNRYSVTLGTRVSGGNYYLSASNTDALEDIFESISEQVGTPSIEVTTEAVIKDIIAASFTLPDGASGITLQTAKRTAEGGWETAEAAPSTVLATVEGDMVSVTGFDFTKNFVTTTSTGRDENDPSAAGDFFGRKLIITFTIKPKDGFLGGNDVPTNGTDSGFYKTASDEQAIGYFEVPTVNVPIQSPTVDLEEKNVYLYGDLTQEELITRTVDGEAVSSIVIRDANGNPLVDEYGKYITSAEDLEDWQTQYATIVITKPAAMTDLTEDQGEDVYKASVVITPIVTTQTSNVGTAATVQNVNDQDKVNVFKPVVTFNDSTVNYLDGATADTYYSSENYQSTVWKHGDTLSTAVIMTGDEPDLLLTYTPAYEWITDSKVTGTTDVSVNVTANIGGTDVSQYTTSVRDVCEDCEHNSSKTSGIMNAFDPEFIVHIKNVYGNLIVEKSGLNAGESAIFTVEGYVADGTANGEEKTWTVVLTGNADGTDTVTLTGLLVGSNYTVTEDNGWTWSYTLNPTKASGKIKPLTDTAATASFENTKSEQWLYDESRVVNKFDQNN